MTFDTLEIPASMSPLDGRPARSFAAGRRLAPGLDGWSRRIRPGADV